MEKGLKLPPGILRNDAALRKAVKPFDWVYFGPEFCENLLEPGLADGLRALAGMKKDVCLLTPHATDKGLGALAKIFAAAAKLKFRGRFEVSVNDFGVLHLIRKMRWSVPVALGRQLSRNFALAGREGLSILNRDGVELLEEFKVRRLSVPLFPGTAGPVLPAWAGRLRFTGFYPYMDVTSTRTCLMGMPDVPAGESPDTVRCARECLCADYKVKNERIRETLVVAGNTVFVESGVRAAPRLRSSRVDRAVFCPDT